MLECIDRHLRTLSLVTFLSWTAQRLGAFAMPFVVLEHTGDAWATGLVAGCMGVALVTSIWWAAPIRHRLRTPRVVAILLVVQAAGAAVVPIGIALDVASVGMLLVSGCVLGVGAALQTPTIKTVTIAWSLDGATSRRALGALAWQDFAQRLPMTFAPLVGVAVLGTLGSVSLVLLQCTLLLVAAGAAATVASPPGADVGDRGTHTGLRAMLSSAPRLTLALALSAVAGLTWFPLPLGLAVLGIEVGRGGELAAAGLAGYGVTTVLTSMMAPRWAGRTSPMPVILATWLLLGSAMMLLPAVATWPWLIAVVAGVGGALVPFGNAALNALVGSLPDETARHTAFTLHLACYSGGTSVGLMVGGAGMAATGAVPMILAAGVAMVMAVVGAALVLRRLRLRRRP